MTASEGTVHSATKIIDHGPDARRFNLVILAEGYTQAEQAKFAADALSTANAILAAPPFDVFRTAINVHRVDISSLDSGADIPCGTPPASARTFLDARYCATGVERLLVVDHGRAIAAARSFVADPNVLVLVNHTKYGGSGGPVSVASLHPDSVRIALHELGHTVFDLADEYQENRTGNPATDYDATRKNVTSQKDAAGAPVVKWPHLVATGTPIPTAVNTGCVLNFDGNPVPAGTVGAFEGAARFNCGAWRSQHRCTMRKRSTPFCRVCTGEIFIRLARHVHQPMEIKREAWSSGWTTLNPFVLNGQPNFISYKAGGGGVSIDRARADGTLEQTMGSSWSTGWTSLVPMATAFGGQFLILYKSATGEAEIAGIDAAGQNVTTVKRLTWEKDWSHLVEFELGGFSHLLSYKTTLGGVSIDRLREDGSGFDTTMGSTWSKGWTSLVPMQVGGRMLLLTYKVSTGDVQISEISANGQDVTILSSHNWGPGWTTFAPFNVDGDAFYVAYNESTGRMDLDRMRPDGSGVDNVLQRTWGPGWTLFAPFVLGGVPHEWVYRASDGAAALDRIF